MQPNDVCTKSEDRKHKWVERSGGNRTCEACNTAQSPDIRRTFALESIANSFRIYLGEDIPVPSLESTETAQVLEQVLAEDSARGLLKALEILSKVPPDVYIRISGSTCVVGTKIYHSTKDLASAIRNAAAALQLPPEPSPSDRE